MLCSNGIVIAKHIFFSETICLREPYLYDVVCYAAYLFIF